MEQGWYRLTADVKNPAPDGRSKRIADQKVWKAGTVVWVSMTKPSVFRSFVEFSDNSRAEFGELGADKNWNKEYCKGNGIIEHLEVVPVTLGRFLKKSELTAEQLLAALIEYDGLKLDRLRELDDHLSVLDEEKFYQFCRKYNLFAPGE